MSGIDKKIIFLISIFLLTSCGYKVLDNSKLTNFNLKEIRTYGDKRTNFSIKNDLVIGKFDKAENNLIIEINTKKNKEIKEKNINNEITKYEISLSSNIKIDFLEKNKQEEFDVSSKGNYAVSDKYSTTLKNEKRLLENLSNDISNKIQSEINLIINDL
tara:strand:- start:6 stop:482 length:477 start_codon:yes stop_codon:yes gene_type:complete